MVVAFDYEFGGTREVWCSWPLTKYIDCWKPVTRMFGRSVSLNQTCLVDEITRARNLQICEPRNHFG